MKKYIVLAGVTISLLFPLGIAAQVVGKNKIAKVCIVSGYLEDVKTGKAYLSCDDTGAEIADSAMVKDGKFTFTVKLKEPIFCSVAIGGVQRSQLGLFLESGNIKIKGRSDSLYNAIVEGSTCNDQWKEWGLAWKNITRQAGPMYKRLDSVTEHGKVKALPADRKIFDDGIKSLNHQTGEAIIAFIKKYPQSPAGPFIIIDRFINYPNPEMEKTTFSLLGNDAKKSFYGRKIVEYDRIAAITGIGASPDFAMSDTAGKNIRLSDLRGKYVLVDFWASWCAPCRKENPNVVLAYQKYHDKGLEIVGVSLDTKKDAWLKAIEKDGLAWKHVSDLKGWQSDMVKEFGITVVPTNFLVNKEGKVIAKNLREEALQKKLEELVK